MPRRIMCTARIARRKLWRSTKRIARLLSCADWHCRAKIETDTVQPTLDIGNVEQCGHGIRIESDPEHDYDHVWYPSVRRQAMEENELELAQERASHEEEFFEPPVESAAVVVQYIDPALLTNEKLKQFEQLVLANEYNEHLRETDKHFIWIRRSLTWPFMFMMIISIFNDAYTLWTGGSIV